MASRSNPDKLNRSYEAGTDRYIMFVRPQDSLLLDDEADKHRAGQPETPKRQAKRATPQNA